MKKLLLVFLLAIFLIFPAMSNAGDTKGIDLVSVFAWGVFPAFPAAADYQPSIGISFLTETKIGESSTLGITYTSWKLNGENTTTDIKGNFIGIRPTFWVYPLDNDFNLYISTGAGYSQIADGDSTGDNLGLVSGIGMMYKITHGTHIRIDCSMAKYGENEDAFDVAVGITFKL